MVGDWADSAVGLARVVGQCRFYPFCQLAESPQFHNQIMTLSYDTVNVARSEYPLAAPRGHISGVNPSNGGLPPENPAGQPHISGVNP
ncbi:hypothetical protein GCM10022235_47630 [Kribbella ginsengisoli]|uniref:Uncharacterized protein n=1 Tax=Kribbella ginsengisoli TaxID=363865 RepID=A0ABP6XUI3_9ACTN